MTVLVDLWSDGASLSIFDPEACEGIDPTASQFPFHLNPYVRDGDVSMIHLPGDGTFRVRITDASPSSEERDLIHHSINRLGLTVSSGRIYVSGMDFPGDTADTLRKHGAGHFVDIEPGKYDLAVHLLRLWDLQPEQRENLPNYLIILSKRTDEFPGVQSKPRLMDLTDEDVARIIAEVEAERTYRCQSYTLTKMTNPRHDRRR